MKQKAKEIINILLVEDNPVDAQVAIDTLKDCRLYQIKTKLVDSLAAAKKYLDKNTPDSILLDLGLPDSNGLETYFKIREAAPEIPAVILSASGDENIALEAIHNGAKDYLIKEPGSYAYLDRAIRYAVEAGQVEGEIRAASHKLRLVSEAAVRLADISTAEDIHQIISNELSMITGASINSVSLFNHESETFTVKSVYGVKKQLVKIINLLGLSIEGIEFSFPGTVLDELKQGGSYRTEDLIEGFAYSGIAKAAIKKVIQTMGIGTLIVTPLVYENKLVGICSTVFTRGEEIPSDIGAFLQVFTRAAAIALQRHEAQRELAQSEESLRLIYDTAGDVLFQLKVEPGNRFRFLSVNKAFLEGTGLTAEQIVGKTTEEVIPEPAHAMVLEKYKEAISENKIVRWEETSEYPSGQKVGDVAVVPVFDKKGTCTHLIGSVHDITERVRIEGEIRETEEKFRHVVEHANDGIVIIQDGLIAYSNIEAAEMEGKSLEEVIGAPFTDNVAPEYQSLIGDNYAATMRGDEIPTGFEIEIVQTEGQRITVDVNASLIEHQGRPAVMAILRDITKRKKAERAQSTRIERYRRQQEAIMKLSSEKYWVEKDLSKSLPGILSIITEAMDVERASYWSVDQDGKTLDCLNLYTQSAGEQTSKMRLTQDEYPEYLRAINLGVPLIVHDAINDPRTAEFRENYLVPLGITSMLDTVVKAGGHMQGIICLEHVGEPRDWTADETAFASFASNKISNFLLQIEREQAQEELQAYQADLEQKVVERTEELNLSLAETETARDRIDGILKSIGDGIIVTDLSNKILLMNRAAEDMLGVQLSDVIDRPIEFAIKDKVLQERLITTLGLQSTGQTFDFELPDSVSEYPRIMRARTAVITDQGNQKTGIITIIHDVSHEREVDRMKTEFISTAAHELRTPLTSIQGFSEILMTRDDLGDDEKARFLGHINRQATALADIINDLLDISRIESGRGFALNLEECEVGASIKAVVEPMITQAQEHKFEVSLPDKPQTLVVDKDKMAQVLENIIGNAVKYSPDGGKIIVSGVVNEGRYVITVEDQGVGMQPEQLKQIFEKFYRADSSDTAIEGTGLGMSIVKVIIDAHKGEVYVESEYGIGTKVTITLPLPDKMLPNR